MEPSIRQEAGKHLILYDGVCGLCNRLVIEVLSRDPKGLFHFASLQSAKGRALVAAYGRNPEALDNMYVVVDHNTPSPRLLARARAALFVVGRLDSPWRILRVFAVLPTFLLDALYSFIARNRYRWFGKLERCLLPSDAYASRFLDL
jgi:predicted DCC family thiol-disulfide oxidoreductase YuxK